MVRKVIFVLLIFPLINSCSTSSLKYPIKAKKYKEDLVKVQTAVNLAMFSYVKGCVDQSKDFKKCRDKAKNHVKENIIFILDQKDKSNENIEDKI